MRFWEGSLRLWDNLIDTTQEFLGLKRYPVVWVVKHNALDPYKGVVRPTKAYVAIYKDLDRAKKKLVELAGDKPRRLSRNGLEILVAPTQYSEELEEYFIQQDIVYPADSELGDSVWVIDYRTTLAPSTHPRYWCIAATEEEALRELHRLCAKNPSMVLRQDGREGYITYKSVTRTVKVYLWEYQPPVLKAETLMPSYKETFGIAEIPIV